MNQLSFKDATQAWAGINEWLLLNEPEIWAQGGGIYGPEFVAYNNFVKIRHLKIDPELDLGSILGYSPKKWTSLVANYCDLNYLELVKSEIKERVRKKAKSYNYTYHFNNAHGGGKDCLISLTFTKRLNKDRPILVFNVRTSEVTKRLIFDFLLCQRIAEYVYGKDQDCELHLFAPSYYITAESVLMYNNYKKLSKLLATIEEKGRFQKRVKKTFKKFMQPEALNQKYKVFQRSAAQIQKNPETGRPMSGVKPMLIKELKLISKSDPIKYPDDCISPKQRSTYKRKLVKEGKLIRKRKPRKSRKK